MKRLFLLIGIFVLCIPALWSLWQPGYFSVHDDMHPAWVLEMSRAVESGQFPPRWAPDLSYGYGYPLFHFIYPLPYYLGVIGYRLGLSLTQSVQMVHGLAIVASAWAMAWFVGYRRPWWIALTCAAIYVYSPYRAVNVYVRGALGENVAWIFLPLILGGLERLIIKGTWRSLAVVSLATAGLMLSHNIAAMVGLPVAGVYALMLLWAEKSQAKIWSWCVAGFAGGLIASMYFWLPALVDKPLMVENAIFNFRDHFPFIKQLLLPSWGYGASVWGPTDEISFQIGLINIALWALSAVAMLYVVMKKQRTQAPGMLLWLAVGGCIYMMNIRSAWIWDAVPLMNYFQFPWRWLWLVVFLVSGVAGWSLSLLPERVQKILAVLVICGVVALNWNYFVPNGVREISDEAIIHRFFAVNPMGPQLPQSEEYATLQEEYLRLPRSVEIRPTTYSFERVRALNPETKVSGVHNYMDAYTFQVEGPGDVVDLDVYAFPGWRATIDGEKRDITPGKPFGQIQISVPSGTHQVSITYGQYGWLRIVNYLSLGMGALMWGLLFVDRELTGKRIVKMQVSQGKMQKI